MVTRLQTAVNPEKVRVIKHHLAVKDKTTRQLAAEFGVSPTTVVSINKGRQWKYI